MIDYDKILSQRTVAIKPSGIRKFFDIAAEMDDVISLGVGEPDFKTPWSIRHAGARIAGKGAHPVIPPTRAWRRFEPRSPAI